MKTNTSEAYTFKKEVVFSFYKGMLISLLLALIWLLVHSAILYFYQKNFSFFIQAIKQSIFNPIFFILVIFAGIIVQEIIKALLLYAMAGVKFNRMKAGFSLTTFMPYVESNYPVTILTYRLLLFVPCLATIQLVWLSYIANLHEWLFITTVWIFFCSFDIITLVKLKNYNENMLVATHPDRPGVLLYDNPFKSEEQE